MQGTLKFQVTALCNPNMLASRPRLSENFTSRAHYRNRTEREKRRKRPSPLTTAFHVQSSLLALLLQNFWENSEICRNLSKIHICFQNYHLEALFRILTRALELFNPQISSQLRWRGASVAGSVWSTLQKTVPALRVTVFTAVSHCKECCDARVFQCSRSRNLVKSLAYYAS